MTSRARWPVAVVVTLTTVAVVTSGHPDADVPANAVLVAAGAVAGVMVVVATGLEYRQQHPFPLRTLAWRLVPLPIALVAMLLVWIVPDLGSDRPFPGTDGSDQPSDREGEGSGESDERTEDASELIDVFYWIVLGVVLVAGVVLAHRLLRHWARRRRPPAPIAPGRPGAVVESDDPEAEWREAQRRAVRAVLARGGAALLDEDDPRRAIVRAYLILEEYVGREGLVRAPAETQREYAARVLAAGGVTDRRHVTELVELFNAARFSTVPIVAADATAAREHIDALVGS